MKIISYNIAKCTQNKIDLVLCMGADLYILPECAEHKRIVLPKGYTMLWAGDEDMPQKGLGVIWKEPLSVHVAKEYRKIKHHLPLIIENDGCRKFILACWPTIWKERKTYPQLLLEALHAYKSYFEMLPSLAIGDFNCYVGQNGVKKETGTFEDCIKVFEMHRMKSVYHEQNKEKFGKESKATYNWRYKETYPFFLDYTFSNVAVRSYVIGEWKKEISDHCPQFIEL